MFFIMSMVIVVFLFISMAINMILDDPLTGYIFDHWHYIMIIAVIFELIGIMIL